MIVYRCECVLNRDEIRESIGGTVMFEWNNDYSVGIEEIDKQHKHLIGIGAELMGMVKHHSNDDLYDDVIDAVERLKDYTVYHFATEERMLEDVGFDGLDEHKIEHQRFIDQLNEVDLTDLDVNQTEFIMDILKFISTWIFKHIIGSDFEYREILAASLKEMSN